MHKKGFTIVELILVITFIIMLFAISTPFFISLNNRNDVNLTYNYLESSIKRSHQLAKSQYMNEDWGVYIDNTNNNLIIYKGEEYTARETARDEVILLPNGVSFDEGDQDINFTELTGVIDTTNTLVMISKDGYSKQLNISSIIN